MKISLLFLWCRGATEFGGRPPLSGTPARPCHAGNPSRPLAVPEKICVPLPRLYLFFSTAALSSPCFIRPWREPPSALRFASGNPFGGARLVNPQTPCSPPEPPRDRVTRGTLRSLHHRWGGAVIQYTFSCSATAEHRIRRRGGWRPNAHHGGRQKPR